MSSYQSNEMLNAKQKEAKCIGSRAAKRIEQIIISINETIHESNANHQFHIHETTKQRMVFNLMQFISLWEGPGGAKTNNKTNTNNAKLYLKVRTYWNHKKAEKLGDYLFSVVLSILFQHLVSTPHVPQLLLFIDIFCKLLNQTIRYPRTKALPLICCASFVKANKFKEFCISFLEYFGPKIPYGPPRMTTTAKVNGKSQTKYIRDSGRSTKQKELYLQCLHRLKQELTSQNDRFIHFSIQRFQQWIIDHDTSDSVPPAAAATHPSTQAPPPSQWTEAEHKTSGAYHQNADIMMPRAVNPMYVPIPRPLNMYTARQPYANHHGCRCNVYNHVDTYRNAFDDVYIDPNAMRNQWVVPPVHHEVPRAEECPPATRFYGPRGCVPLEHNNDRSLNGNDALWIPNEYNVPELLSRAPNSFMDLEYDDDGIENMALDVLIDMNNGL